MHWRENGQKIEEAIYDDYKKNGHCILYKNGKKFAEGEMFYDSKVGMWTYYDEDGTPTVRNPVHHETGYRESKPMQTEPVNVNKMSYDEIIEYCALFDDQHVYRPFNNVFIIIFKKLDDSTTNEDRLSITYPKNAIYIANKLQVVDILNVRDKTNRVLRLTEKFAKHSLIYEAGKVVEHPSYHDVNDNRLFSCYPSFAYSVKYTCANGILYFKTIKRALADLMLTRKYKTFYSNGQKAEVGYFTEITENNSIIEFCGLVKTGLWAGWNRDGSMIYKGYYNGECSHKNGHWTHYKFGEFASSGEYFCGVPIGKWYCNKDNIRTEFIPDAQMPPYDNYKDIEGDYNGWHINHVCH